MALKIGVFLAFLAISVQTESVQIDFDSLLGKSLRTHPEFGLDIAELTKAHGYPLELHEVETEDGYILGVHRIPHGKSNANETNKPAVYLMHGIISCSADWVNVGPEKSLAYKLADLGYDVWIGNARGNTESRKHKTLDPDNDKAYWSFTWNEIGYYDLPATIDYILAETRQKQLQYVGFSQGTTSFFVMASSRPEYNAKIKLSSLLAPVAEMSHIKNPLIKLVAPFERGLFSVANLLGVNELIPRDGFFEKLALELCDEGKPTQEICKIFLFMIAGYNRPQLDGDFIPVIATNTPAGSSVKQFIHYFQVMGSTFKRFDYHDEAVNMEVYGEPKAPKYDLGQITAPVAMYYGLNDWLASEVDAEITASQIPNVVRFHQVVDPAFCHLDFAWAIDIDTLLFEDVIEFITQYN